jgi:hypothetical protein
VILQDAAAGEIFAAGHAEPGNETSIVMSATKAERVQGGYKFTGRKAFGSLTPGVDASRRARARHERSVDAQRRIDATTAALRMRRARLRRAGRRSPETRIRAAGHPAPLVFVVSGALLPREARRRMCQRSRVFSTLLHT